MPSIDDALGQSAPEVMRGSLPGHDYILVRCPFHKGGQEKTPSCSLSKKKPVFFCHACHEGGHIKRFLIHVGVNHDVAQKIVDNTNFSEPYKKKVGPLQFLHGKDPFRGEFILSEDVLDEYRLQPMDLRKAGFHKKTLLHFEVGFDLENYRIIYPIRNIYGELVGMSGRTVVGDEPRYKIYRRELIEKYGLSEEYSMNSVKDSLLWHGHICHPFLFMSEDPVVITEGYKACMWVWQSGITDVMALQGSYLSDNQHMLLGRTKSPIILFLDNNDAGIKGTYFAGMKLRGSNRVFVSSYPDDREQPDDLSPIEVEEAITGATPFKKWKKEHKDVVYEHSWKWKGRKGNICGKG